MVYAGKEVAWLLVETRRGNVAATARVETSQKVQEAEGRACAPAKQNMVEKEGDPVLRAVVASSYWVRAGVGLSTASKPG